MLVLLVQLAVFFRAPDTTPRSARNLRHDGDFRAFGYLRDQAGRDDVSVDGQGQTAPDAAFIDESLG